MDITFDTYYTYAQLTERLAWLAEQHPGIMQVAALGQSYEGRDIPLVILTHRETGPDTEKPAFWIDANIHATEVTASMAALYFVKKMVEGYGGDPRRPRSWYICITRLITRLQSAGIERAIPRAARLSEGWFSLFKRSDVR